MMQSITWDTWGNTWDSLWHLGTIFCCYIPMQQNFSCRIVSKSNSVYPADPASFMWKYEKELIYMFVILILYWGISCTYSLLFWRILLVLKLVSHFSALSNSSNDISWKKMLKLWGCFPIQAEKKVRSLKYDSRHFFPLSEQTPTWHLTSNDF